MSYHLNPLKLAKHLVLYLFHYVSCRYPVVFSHTMRLALLFGLIGSAKASVDYFEPFPTCADCLPASVHDAPGIGFSLSLTSGYAVLSF